MPICLVRKESGMPHLPHHVTVRGARAYPGDDQPPVFKEWSMAVGIISVRWRNLAYACVHILPGCYFRTSAQYFNLLYHLKAYHCVVKCCAPAAYSLNS